MGQIETCEKVSISLAQYKSKRDIDRSKGNEPWTDGKEEAWRFVEKTKRLLFILNVVQKLFFYSVVSATCSTG